MSSGTGALRDRAGFARSDPSEKPPSNDSSCACAFGPAYIRNRTFGLRPLSPLREPGRHRHTPQAGFRNICVAASVFARERVGGLACYASRYNDTSSPVSRLIRAIYSSSL
jgi:hypothetical protein